MAPHVLARRGVETDDRLDLATLFLV